MLVNTVMVVLQVVVSMAVLFLLYRFLVATLGVERLGIWSLLLASVTVARLSELGLGSSVTRYVARYRGKNENETAAQVVETGLLTIGLVMALLMAGYPFFKWLLQQFVVGPSSAVAISLLPYAVVSVWLSSLFGVALAGLDGCQRIDLRCVLMLLSHVLILVLAYILVPQHGLTGLVWAQLIQNVFLLVAGWLLLRRELRGLAAVPHRWNKGLCKEMLGYGAQFQVASIAMMLYDPITKALLSRFGGLALVGYYEMASQMVTKLRALLVTGNQVLVPIVAEHDDHASPHVTSLYRDAYSVVMYLALPFYAGIIAVVPLVAVAWFGHYEHNFVVFSILIAIGWFVNTINGPAFFANLGSGRLRWNTVSHVAIGILNIALGLSLGSVLGGTGVVLGWSMALAIGSMVIIVAYRGEHGGDAGPILTVADRLLALASICGAILGLALYTWLAGKVSPIGLAGIVVSGFVLVVLPPAWRHPMRSRLTRWVRRMAPIQSIREYSSE